MRDRAGILSPRSDPPQAGLRWNYRLRRWDPTDAEPEITRRSALQRIGRGWKVIDGEWHKPCSGYHCQGKLRPVTAFHSHEQSGPRAYSWQCALCTARRRGGRRGE